MMPATDSFWDILSQDKGPTVFDTDEHNRPGTMLDGLAALKPAFRPHDHRWQRTGPPRWPQFPRWVHEIKHDGHRLVVIVAGDAVRLLSRNGRDRTAVLGLPRLTMHPFCGK